MSRFAPNASVKTRIILAALLWSLIGLMLMTRGFFALNGTGREWLFLVAFLVGGGKSYLVLDRVAEKNLIRISAKGGKQCLGGIYSWQSWLLVFFMIALGRLLRASSLPLWFVGSVYCTVGVSLFWSSRKGWTFLFGKHRNLTMNG